MSKIVFKIAKGETGETPVKSETAAALVHKLCIQEGYHPVTQYLGGGYIVITVEKEGESQDAEILL